MFLDILKILREKRNKVIGTLFIGVLIFVVFIFKGSQAEDPCFLAGQGSLRSEFLTANLLSPSFSLKEPYEISLIQENQLLFSAPPNIVKTQVLGALASEEEPEEGRREIIEYTIKEGDSLSSIASLNGISLQTLLWANDLSNSSVIRPGQKLIILPVSGVIHMVKTGDTLSQIAETYGGKVEEIIAFNELSEEGEIFMGDLLIIPNGKMPERPPVVKQAPLASSYFICPISSPCRITQGLHWYNAIDFGHAGNSCGQPVFAAAGGKVLKTKFGYNRGAGNYIHIEHPNGVVTHYGHLQSILVVPGQNVSQGQLIGLIGHTGYTIPAGAQGCHLHFEVRGARNPFAY